MCLSVNCPWPGLTALTRCATVSASEGRPSTTPSPAMTKDAIGIGTTLIQKAHPEYGAWVVVAVDSEWAEVRGRRGDKVLFFGELHLWQPA